MKKGVLIFVGGSIGVWIGNRFFKKFIKPKFDKRNKEYEDKINQATNEMIEEMSRHNKAIDDINREYGEWKKERDEQFAREMEELDRKLEGYRKRLKDYDSLIS